MTSTHPFARAAVWLALSAVASLAHAADQAAALTNPADADVVVPAFRYQSAMTYRLAPTDSSSPAQNWKALNQQVGAYDSMALSMGGAPQPHAAAATQQPGASTKAAPPQHQGMPPMRDQPAAHAQPAAGAPDPHGHHKHKEAK